jgi:CBS domain-containing protein
MSAKLLVVSKDNGLEHALRQMHEAGVRRAPIVDSRGELVALLSVDDVIDYIARVTDQIAATLRTEYGVERRTRP